MARGEMHKLFWKGTFLFITSTFLLFPCVMHGTVTIALSFCRLRPACGEVLPPARNLCGFTVLPSVSSIPLIALIPLSHCPFSTSLFPPHPWMLKCLFPVLSQLHRSHFFPWSLSNLYGNLINLISLEGLTVFQKRSLLPAALACVSLG